MIDWLRDVVRTGSEVVASRADLVEGRLRQLAPILAVSIMIGCVGGVAICGMLGGGVIFLAPHIGLGAALLLISSVSVTAMAILLAVSYRRASVSVQASAGQSEAAREHLGALLAPKTPKAPKAGDAVAGGDDAAPDLFHQVINTVASNPTVIASGAFAAISVLGVRRTVRIIRAASALATVGAVASQIAASTNDVSLNGHPSSEHPTAAPQTGASRDGSQLTPRVRTVGATASSPAIVDL